MFYYLCRQNTLEWYTVSYGAYESREELKQKALEIARSASDWEDAVIAQSYTFVATDKKIGIGKNINRRWIKGMNDCVDSQDAELKQAFAALKEFIE